MYRVLNKMLQRKGSSLFVLLLTPEVHCCSGVQELKMLHWRTSDRGQRAAQRAAQTSTKYVPSPAHRPQNMHVASARYIAGSSPLAGAQTPCCVPKMVSCMRLCPKIRPSTPAPAPLTPVQCKGSVCTVTEENWERK